ncbi:hypothetical protein chiPu_0015415 [Chiloscyllium punctatum]|uniref:Uncharacterized protein n=1 Tax=Chiloscyllium punctatum TaxID=137246 RepID=A0A401T2N1_CHIPU|nr:hypothetical protein [Chiloscyllium punctatum]
MGWCCLETEPCVVWILGLVRFGDCSKCSLEHGNGVVCTLDHVRTEDWPQRSQETWPATVWRLGPMCSGEEVWTQGSVQTGGCARCSLETGPSAVWRIGPVLSGDWVQCHLDNGPSAVWRTDPVQTGDCVW